MYPFIVGTQCVQAIYCGTCDSAAAQDTSSVFHSHLRSHLRYLDQFALETRAVIEKGEKMYGPDFMLLDKKEQKEIMLRFFGQLYEDKDVDDDVRDEILTLAMLFKEKLEDMGFRSSVIDST
ncbi:hypothetical protein RB195_026550 [Necator americanus]|uniref:Uncharacterized protein n=1 Tax=Necator americanus TaxID=51031 RepID=A0ABR1EXU1_NECAM